MFAKKERGVLIIILLIGIILIPKVFSIDCEMTEEFVYEQVSCPSNLKMQFIIEEECIRGAKCVQLVEDDYFFKEPSIIIENTIEVSTIPISAYIGENYRFLEIETEIDQNINEINEYQEVKSTSYRLLQFFGMKQEEEQKDYEELIGFYEKVNELIEELTILTGEINDPELLETINTKLDQLEFEKLRLELQIEQKRKNIAGFLSFISGL